MYYICLLVLKRHLERACVGSELLHCRSISQLLTGGWLLHSVGSVVDSTHFSFYFRTANQFSATSIARDWRVNPPWRPTFRPPDQSFFPTEEESSNFVILRWCQQPVFGSVFARELRYNDQITTTTCCIRRRSRNSWPAYLPAGHFQPFKTVAAVRVLCIWNATARLIRAFTLFGRPDDIWFSILRSRKLN